MSRADKEAVLESCTRFGIEGQARLRPALVELDSCNLKSSKLGLRLVHITTTEIVLVNAGLALVCRGLDWYRQIKSRE